MRIITLKMQKGIPRAQREKSKASKKCDGLYVCDTKRSQCTVQTAWHPNKSIYLIFMTKKETSIQRQKRSTITFFRFILYPSVVCVRVRLCACVFFFALVPSANICLSNCQRIQNHKHTIQLGSLHFGPLRIECTVGVEIFKLKRVTMKESDPKEKICLIINETNEKKCLKQ